MSIQANITTIKDLFEKDLCIPDYQRAYRWTNTNVMQLLEDVKISMETGKCEYRLGTIILYHSNNSRYEIVDGQQRLTTILLIMTNLYGRLNFKAWESLQYQLSSFSAIRDNSNFISDWLKDKPIEWRENFSKYLLENCRIAEIIVNDLSEAFQMFDTQNGRGKNLELYNLLKAYHIRAMEQNSQDEKIRCDREWEEATQYDATPEIENDPNVDILKQLFSEQLFKGRLWCRGDIFRENGTAKTFSKDDIKEFKGFTIDKNHSIEFPFQNPFLLQYMTEKFYQNVLSGTIGTKSRFESGETDRANPFVNINQTIINGKAFFEYVQTYVELYKKMFIELGTYQLADFKEFFFLYCLIYNPENVEKWKEAKLCSDSFKSTVAQSRRSGDSYLRETYKSLCFVLFDKFGEKVFKKYYRTLYRLIYQSRLQNRSVKYITAMKAPIKYFTIIQRAQSYADLFALDKLAGELNRKRYEHEDKIDNDVLIKFIKEGK